MTSKPSGTVTFLFTDIENSTQLAREHPESWKAARARHHAILREAIELNNGFVFQVIGDAFCAAFHKAGDALKAAVRLNRTCKMNLGMRSPFMCGWGFIQVKQRSKEMSTAVIPHSALCND